MIVALTPNPSIDRTVVLDRPLRPGRLQRPRRVREDAGGKGINVARAIRGLGGEAVAAGFVAGWNGRKLRGLLAAEGIDGIFVDVEGETRECHILLDPPAEPSENSGKAASPHPTELNERGPIVGAEAWTALLAQLPEGVIAMCGSWPPCPPGEAESLHDAVLRGARRPSVVDASGATLAAAVRAGVDWAAPNLGEARRLLDDTLGGADAGRMSTGELLVAMARMHERYGTRFVVSLGAEGAALIGEDRVACTPPDVDVTNPVGSGDALLAAFLWARSEGLPDADALRWGVAAGTENARRGGGGHITRSDVEELTREVRSRPF